MIRIIWGVEHEMIFLVATGILLVVGYLIKYKKIAWLISGYNTSSKEEKAKYDVDRLCKYVGNYIFILAAMFLILAIVVEVFGEDSKIFAATGIAIAAVAIGGIIYLNTGDKLKK